MGLSKPCGLKTSHLIGANCLRNKRWLVVALPDVRSKVTFPTWLASSQKSTFNNNLSFTWSKKYTNEEVVPTLTTQYILHVQSSHTNVNQVFQNCHVCIFFSQMFESALKSSTKGEEAQWLGNVSSQSCGKKGQLAYSLIQWSARTGAFRGECCPSNDSLQNNYKHRRCSSLLTIVITV